MRASALFFTLFSVVALGGTAPSFQGDLMDGGGSVSLKDQLAKGKPVWLSFWATWCGPCLEELDHVTANLKKEPLDLTVLTVNADTSDTQAQVKPTYRQHKFEFPVVLDPKHEILNKYHSDGSLPFSVLINPKGEIVSTFNGYSETMFAQIRDYVKKGATPPSAGAPAPGGKKKVMETPKKK